MKVINGSMLNSIRVLYFFSVSKALVFVLVSDGLAFVYILIGVHLMLYV